MVRILGVLTAKRRVAALAVLAGDIEELFFFWKREERSAEVIGAPQQRAINIVILEDNKAVIFEAFIEGLLEQLAFLFIASGEGFQAQFRNTVVFSGHFLLGAPVSAPKLH